MMKTLKRKSLFVSWIFVSVLISGCGSSSSSTSSSSGSAPSSSSSSEIEDYYSINTSSILTEMLVGTSKVLEPTFLNLGDPATPSYGVSIVFEGQDDVTSDVYVSNTKTFTPTNVGAYDITFTILNDQGAPLVTASGNSFSAIVTINAVIQSFVPVNLAGPYVTIDED